MLDLSVAVLGNADFSEFGFLPLQNEIPSDEELLNAAAEIVGRGWHYVGVMGYAKGSPRVSLEGPLTEFQVRALVEGFRQFCEAVLAQMEVQFLGRLFEIKDPRPDA